MIYNELGFDNVQTRKLATSSSKKKIAGNEKITENRKTKDNRETISNEETTGNEKTTSLDKISFVSFDERFTRIIFVIKEKDIKIKNFTTFPKADKDLSLENSVSQTTQDHFRVPKSRGVKVKLIKHMRICDN